MKREIRIGLFLTGAFVILAVIIFIVGDLAEAVPEARLHPERPAQTRPWGSRRART